MSELTHIGFSPVDEIKSSQLNLLKKTLKYVAKTSAFYSKLFSKHGIDPAKFITLADIRNIPTTTKDDLASHPDDFLCVPKSKIADFTTTSGTMGNPISVCLTANDIDRLALNEAISMQTAGCTSDDIFQLATTMDKRFMAGLAYNEGVRKLGAGIVRVGASAPSLQWDSIKRFEPTVIIAIPSFILALMEYARANNIDFRKSSLKKLIAIGQPVRTPDLQPNLLAKRIAEEWGLKIYSTYASTEMGCAFTECEAGQGGHLNADLLFLEILDEAGNEVQDGAVGEVVVTTLGVEGMPLIRYRTGDLAAQYTEKCRCGRCTPRLGPVVGRKQQMIKYKGTTVHPSSLIPILDTNKSFRLYLIELITDDLGLDGLNLVFAEEEVGEAQAEKIVAEVGDLIKVKPTWRRVPGDRLKRLILDPSSRKPLKILDRRNG